MSGKLEYPTAAALVRDMEESSQRLTQLEAEIEKRIIGRITTGPNALDATWTVFELPMSMERRFVCKYQLNGVDHTFETTKDLFKLSRGPRVNDLLKEVFEDFAKHFIRHFVPAMLETASHSFRPTFASGISQR